MADAKFKIEEIIAKMTPEQQQEFKTFCGYTESISDIYYYLKESGYGITIASVAAWYTSLKKPGVRAKQIISEAKAYSGITPVDSLSLVEGVSIELISEIRDRITASEELTDKDFKYLNLVSGLMREARSAASSKQALNYVKERSSLELAGAQRACELVVGYFEGTTFEESLREAVKGILLQIQQENHG